AIMYLDFVTDSILKGLNQQVGVVKINIIDTIMCIILIYLILPAYSTIGYIFVIFISEITNGILSVGMLIRTTEFEFKFINWILKPTFAAFASGVCVHLIKITNPFVSAGVFALAYFIFLSALGCIQRNTG
ncbi:MAG: polysaccharide biosynthesis C-terminal domain-containing protein, partial [Clostridia bacterium]|nr:polysaccharide biosynthesis C-terminal domain-containing protein [Clostridia bacterium]